MGFLDSLFSGGTLPNVESSSATTQSLPPWFAELLRANALKASAIAGEDYQQYTGQRNAAFNADQQGAFDHVRSGIGQFDPYFTSGRDMVTSAGGGFDQGRFDSYYNPHMERVTDRIAELGARNLSENLLPAVNSTFTGAGQWGGSRHEDFMARALRDSNESILGEQGRALAQGYDSAMRNYQEGEGRTLAAGEKLGALGTAGQSSYLRDAAALEGIGGTQQQQDQRNLDTGYSDFLSQRDYPRQNVSFLSSVLRGTQVPTSQSTTTTAPAQQSQMAPSPLSQVGGAGLGIYSLGKAFNWFAKGGQVKKRLPPMGRGIGRLFGEKDVNRPWLEDSAVRYADGGEVYDRPRPNWPRRDQDTPIRRFQREDIERMSDSELIGKRDTKDGPQGSWSDWSRSLLGEEITRRGSKRLMRAEGGPVTSDEIADDRDPPRAPPTIYRPDTRRTRKPLRTRGGDEPHRFENDWARLVPAAAVFRAHGGAVRGIGHYAAA